jgi:hypothetical protein
VLPVLPVVEVVLPVEDVGLFFSYVSPLLGEVMMRPWPSLRIVPMPGVNPLIFSDPLFGRGR